MFKRFLPLIVFGTLVLAAFIALRTSGIEISLASLQENRDVFADYVQAHYVFSLLIFLGVYASVVALSLPAASLLTLLGGFLFGRWVGTLIVVTAATIGATIIFLVAQTSLGATLKTRAGKLYTCIEDQMKDGVVSYLLFMRLVPLFPFFLVNIVPALFNVPARTFIWTTFVGIIPGTFVYVNLGEALGEIQNFDDLVSAETILALSLLGLFALLPIIYKKVFRRA